MGDISANSLADGAEQLSPETQVAATKQNEIKLTDYMRECLDKVALNENFKNYKLIVDQGSAVGDGFVGVIYKATIQERDNDRKLEVVLKFPPSQERRNDFGAMDLFEREVFTYNEVFPALVKFQLEKNIEDSEGFFNFPKCYLAEFNVEKNDSIIIMEDLRESGHKLLIKHVPVDFEHTKLVVEALGRLHAVSFAIKAQQPELFDKFRSLKDFVFEKYDQAGFTPMMLESIEKAANTLDESDSENRSKVLILKNNYTQITEELIDPNLAEPYTVIGQGDCWTNNLMFQYKNGSVDRVVLLDWQNCRYCSPILDLINFFYGCNDETLRAKHYDELLSAYHKSLKELLDRLGGNTEKQFPLKALLDQFRRFGKYGIVMGSMIIPANSKGDEEIDVHSAADNVELLKQMSSQGGEFIKRRLREAVMDAIHRNYL